MSLRINSPAFGHEETIPDKYTCKGEDLSPPLEWGGMPEGTESLVLICDDPDAPAGTFDHWLLFNIPPNKKGLPEGISNEDEQEDGSMHGKNSFGRNDYGGPCPPPGKPHRYFFKLYALDKKLWAPPGSDKDLLQDEMEGHVLDSVEMIGMFGR